MTKIIKLKKGLDIPLQGAAQALTRRKIRSERYTFHAADYTGCTLRSAVRQGNRILAGSPIFYNKVYPDMKVVSPVSGRVSAVVRGAKRKLEHIIVEADGKGGAVSFGRKFVQTFRRTGILLALAEAGILALFRQRPYDVVIDPTEIPRDIFVSCFDSAPLAPDADYTLRGNEADFLTGLEALTKLTPGHVFLGLRAGRTAFQDLLDSAPVRILRRLRRVEFEGPHPAGNVGVQINRTRPVNKGEVVWTARPEVLIFIGRLFNTGIVDLTRLVALTGPEVKEADRAYYPMLPGASIERLVRNRVTTGASLRYISGNVLTGTQIPPNGALHALHNHISIIAEGNETDEFLGWMRPRTDQFSTSHSYPAFLLKHFPDKHYDFDARLKGSPRAMILANEWESVFPMTDIPPEFLIRAILGDDFERMESLGIYEVAPEDFALCEFVDSSKMELQRLIREGLDTLRNEMN
jgi:Na+-transporting NADH:ubiquinone oxidoreductase subunit A